MRSLAVVALTGVTILSPARPAVANPADICGALARETERAEGIPPGLVHAVALAESGRWLAERGHSQAWPWTVTAGSESFYLASKQDALRKIRELRAAGRSNIDVGCMQVNLGYHGEAFASLDEALEPASNIAYGARFLKRLRLQTRSWVRATARYHSSDPDRGEAYRNKVYRLWHELRHGPIAAAQPPVRLAGSLLSIQRDSSEVEPAARRRVILPMTGAKNTSAAPGAISILRGR
ncbi:MAG TPA: transglycosylase SLT domain-containing protein [Geminicoccaceae bacterium]|nr:transglycosylase SLT domain-containing protein [Geminicoccaceae bacterium]